MARKHFIVPLLSLFLVGCAQIGTITGGPVDVNAPKPKMDQVNPPHETINFTGNSVEIPFDEYFRLSNASQNIRMVPPHATVKASVNKKTLYLSWDEQLQPNTTYAIYMNEAVTDITEGNDSTMQYVFSTGSYIDSLTYSVGVTDAWTGKPKNNITVGLFEPTSNKLISFAKTNEGLAELKYLPAGTFNILAFNDQNGDLEWQENEAIAFPDSGTLRVDSSRVDSIPLQLFTPKGDPKISAKFLAPSTFYIGSNEPIYNAEVFINGNAITDVYEIEKDSIVAFQLFGEETVGEIVVKTAEFSDTTKYTVRPSDRKKRVTSKKKSEPFYVEDNIVTIEFNDLITDVVPSHLTKEYVTITHIEDTLVLSPEDYMLTYYMNTLSIKRTHEEVPLGLYNVQLKPEAVTLLSGKSPKVKVLADLKSETKFGTLQVDVSAYNSPIIVELLKGNNVMGKVASNGSEKVLEFKGFLADSYTFRVIHDDNQNGLWDVGDFPSLTQPERVDYYTKPTKLRANWTVEVTLTPSE